jgi:hypothetical protein
LTAPAGDVPDTGGVFRTPEPVPEAFNRFAKLGVWHFIIRFADVLPETQEAKLFVELVIAYFK